jgi:adenylate cyclase class IV
MEEVEVKILEINHQKVVQALEKSNAKKIIDDHILTLFFDFKDNRIHNRKDVLRLRQMGKETELTYKEVRFENSAKVAQEYSIKVSD